MNKLTAKNIAKEQHENIFRDLVLAEQSDAEVKSK